MKKYYIILTLVFVAGCGSDSTSVDKKTTVSKKQSVANTEADNNAVSYTHLTLPTILLV